MIRSHCFVWLSFALAALPAQSAPRIVRDLEPGASGSSPVGFVPVRDRVLFVAQTAANGTEVWSTDGTSARTNVVDLAPGAASGVLYPLRLHALGDDALFFGTDGVRRGTFATDGTSAGTRFLVAPTFGGVGVELARGIAGNDGVAYFAFVDGVNRCDLYRTDGTTAGTTLLQTIAARSVPEIHLAASRAFVSVAKDTGYELWTSDGTATGTQLLRTFAGAVVERFAALGSHIVFRVWDQTYFTQVIVSDGTPAGTVPLAGIPPCTLNHAVHFGGALFLVLSPVGGSVELWRTDLSPTGASRVAVLIAGAGGTTPPALVPASLVAADDALYVRIGDTWHSQLWRSDGTPAGTQGFFPFRLRIHSEIVAAGDRLVFSVLDANGTEPWLSDGTTNGTRMLADLRPGGGDSAPSGFVLAANLASGPAVVFAANDGAAGSEPWIVPATAVGLAALRRVRASCASAGVPPRLSGEGAPRVGNATFAVRIEDATPSSSVALLIASGLTEWSGCAVLSAAAATVVATTNANGVARIAMPVPFDPSLIGARLYAQPAVARAGGFVLGVVDLGGVCALVVGG